MQSVESQYIDHLSEDKTKCVLIEEVPTYTKNEIPNTFQMSEKLFSIGYYEMEGDPYGAKEHKKNSILCNSYCVIDIICCMLKR